MKRWIALLASILMQTCLGMVYAWSTFVPGLQHEHGISAGQSGLIFGLCIASFTVSMVFGGRLQQKFGPRRIGAVGGALFLAGYTLGAASAGHIPVLLAGFGLLAGAGFGLGGVFFAKAGQHMLNAGIPVLPILQRIGWVVGAAVIACSTLLFVPEEPAGEPGSQTAHSLRSILKNPRFRILFWQMFCGTFGGLLIIGNLKSFGMAGGLSADAAVRAVMLFAVGNASGRILWGLWYDRFGPAAISVCILLLGVGAALMGLHPVPSSFYTATLIAAFAFGGCFVLFAARVADEFGAHRISEIYPLIFLGYGIAGLAGPPSGGWMLACAGAPLLPCLTVVLLAAGGLGSSVRALLSNKCQPQRNH